MEDIEVIIHSNTNDNSNIVVSTRIDEKYTIDDLAKYVVPEGFKYKIVKLSELPTSNMFQSTWMYDFENSYDGVGMNKHEWRNIMLKENKL